MDVERILVIGGLLVGVVLLFWYLLRLQDDLDVRPNRQGEHDPWRGRWFDWTDKR